MKIAFYNQMFGLNGKSFWSNILGHWAVHYQSNKKEILGRTDLNRTTEIFRKNNFDIIGICEVLSSQQEELKSKLEKLGYKYFSFFQGHKLKHQDIYVTELIASKIPFKKLNLAKWPVENKLGGGGGFGGVYISKLKTTFFIAHLSLPNKKYFNEQIGFIKKTIDNTKGKIILIGDFNSEYQKIKNFFQGFSLASNEIKTCSTTPIIKSFFCKDRDHILIRGFDVQESGEIKGFSDHKLLWANLR